MLKLTRVFRILTMALALLFAVSLSIPDSAAASGSESSVCKKRKRKKRRKTRRAKRPRRAKRSKRAKRARAKRVTKAKRITYKSVLRWYRRGVKEEVIVKRAKKAAWKPTARDIKRLEAKYVSEKLVNRLVSLRGADAIEVSAPAPAAIAKAPARTPAPKKIDLEKTIDPNDIDFDSVPPPKGSPAWVVKKQKQEKGRKLDRSLRPSQPLKSAAARRPATRADGDDEANKGKRRVVVAASKS